ncbi:M1 family metallopeptidase [Pseudoduganella sp. GCM10020061]|uniref:M1 family metallopeptidase n=1 Tax=Pseudoduganella sp. GCM10020061 TaxID=3317345 RepID=UPI0036426628
MRRTLLVTSLLSAFASIPAIAAPAPSNAPARAIAADATTQLPRHTAPSHYDVSITPNAANATYTARTTITLTVLEPTASITLNATEMAFASAQLTGASGMAQQPKIAVDEQAQTATFTFAQPLPRGEYKLALDYSGKIGTQAVGLFSLDYDTPQGKKRALYTQFENSDARRVIPSWDEPAYKATFTLEAIVPADQMAVSNMPVKSTGKLPDGRKKVQFGRSPKMSTYLLFFALGDFERATKVVAGTELGVVTKRGNIKQAQYVLDESGKLLKEFNSYFGVPYPLPKLDNVAAPGRSQFFGAMENWGAIFTFEYALLLDPAISTQGDKQGAFQIDAHEMAHQWFGNLVTMRWWDDLWLNEGFASWMESRMTEKLHPEWNSHLSAVAVREDAMNRDSVASTHPVVQKIDTVEQASQAFDNITYQKGEAVIRMLENYVGETAWREGVRAYIKKYAYQNTVSDDLWREIEKAARKPITAIAHDFTLQPGVPMLRVADASCKSGNTQVSVTQDEFTRDRPGKQPLAWRVPVVAQTVGSISTARTLVSGGKGTFTVPGCGPLVINAGQAGYYRTVYSDALFARLAKDFAKVKPIDQLGILSDSWALGMAGVQDPANFFDLANTLPLSADPQVWGRVAGVFNGLDDRYRGDEARQQKFRAYALKRLRPVMEQTGWTARKGELETIATLREQLIVTLGQLGDPAVIAEARRRYAASATDPSAMPGPLRKTIMHVVAYHADAATWDKLRAAARAEKSQLIKDSYYELLASPADKALAQRALELALTDEPGVTNSADMIATVAQNHPEMALDFALANLAKVNERVDATSRSRYIPRLAGDSGEQATIAKLEKYAQEHLAPTSRRDAETAAANIATRIKVRNELLPKIDKWLAAH